MSLCLDFHFELFTSQDVKLPKREGKPNSHNKVNNHQVIVLQHTIKLGTTELVISGPMRRKALSESCSGVNINWPYIMSLVYGSPGETQADTGRTCKLRLPYLLTCDVLVSTTQDPGYLLLFIHKKR